MHDQNVFQVFSESTKAGNFSFGYFKFPILADKTIKKFCYAQKYTTSEFSGIIISICDCGF